ncbi:MAG: VC_2705 family sodium/solute symporter [Saprospiraceae bacterium]
MLDKLDQVCRDLGSRNTRFRKKSTIDLAFVTAALMLGTAGLPHVIVRFFTVPNVKDARKSAGWALLFIALLYTTAPAIAVFSRTNLISTVENKPYTELPAWFHNWEGTGLLKFEDKNGDGRVQYYNDANPEFVAETATPNGWQGSELTVDRDIMVMANPEIANLPAWVVALVVAGGLAAALSTAAGLLLVISTSISHDLLKNWLKPTITEKGELRAARITIAIAVIIAGWAGIDPPGYVAQVVAFAFGLAAASFFPAIIMGIFSKRVNRQGAIAGMLTGLIFTTAYIVYFKFLGGTPDGYWWGISPEGIGTVGMLLNFVVSLTVTFLTPPPPLHVQQMIDTIRLPDE